MKCWHTLPTYSVLGSLSEDRRPLLTASAEGIPVAPALRLVSAGPHPPSAPCPGHRPIPYGPDPEPVMSMPASADGLAPRFIMAPLAEPSMPPSWPVTARTVAAMIVSRLPRPPAVAAALPSRPVRGWADGTIAIPPPPPPPPPVHSYTYRSTQCLKSVNTVPTGLL